MSGTTPVSQPEDIRVTTSVDDGFGDVLNLDAAARAYTALSTTIEKSAKRTGTTFVGLDKAFRTRDTTPTKINGRSVPANAAAICTLTNICTGADIHLTDEGAATVARVLAKAAEQAGVS